MCFRHSANRNDCRLAWPGRRRRLLASRAHRHYPAWREREHRAPQV